MKKARHILLVEDEIIIAMEEKISLESHGFTVTHADCSEDVIKLFEKEHDFDLVLMDINLRGTLDGTDTAKEILKKTDIPIIFLSSHTESEIIRKTEDITSYGYIVKNSGETVLIASVKMAFRLFEAKLAAKLKEDALIENEKKSRLIMDAFTEAVFLHPLQQIGFARFEDVNDMACQMYGYTKEEFCKLTTNDIIRSSDAAQFEKSSFKERLLNKKSIRMETVHLTKNGKEIPVEINSKVINLDGRNMILAVARDITERKRNLEVISGLKMKYEAVFNGMVDTSWIIDFNGNVIDANKTASSLLGYSKKELLRIGLEGIDRSLSFEQIKELCRTMEEDKIQKFETTHRTKSGRVIPVEVFSSIITFNNEKAILSIARDRTEHKQAEDEIKRQLDEKENMLKAIHHRIKNNISSIEGLLNLQLQTVDNSEAGDVLRDAVNRIGCMRALYDTLLTAENSSSVSLKPFILKIIESIQKMFPGKEYIQIETEIHDFPVEQVMMFPLGVIVEELLTNIMKYAFPIKQEDNIFVLLQKKDGWGHLLIQDNGVGLPDTVDADHTESFGLMIISMLVQQLKGKLEITNKKGVGFKINFPLS